MPLFMIIGDMFIVTQFNLLEDLLHDVKLSGGAFTIPTYRKTACPKWALQSIAIGYGCAHGYMKDWLTASTLTDDYTSGTLSSTLPTRRYSLSPTLGAKDLSHWRR